MQPLFITGNSHKAKYLAKVLNIQLEHQKLDLTEIQDINPHRIVEHKVKQAYELVGQPVLVEDTSLTFTTLDGLPGPFIKFFLESPRGLDNLCRMLDGFTDRSAYGSVIYGYYDGSTEVYFQGKLDGQIAQHPRGDGGYGWDPIFEPEGYGGLTRAELSPDQDAQSYRQLRDIQGLQKFLLRLDNT